MPAATKKRTAQKVPATSNKAGKEAVIAKKLEAATKKVEAAKKKETTVKREEAKKKEEAKEVEMKKAPATTKKAATMKKAVPVNANTSNVKTGKVVNTNCKRKAPEDEEVMTGRRNPAQKAQEVKLMRLDY